MKEQIFKLQRPIVTNEPQPMALLYNEDKSIYAQIEMTPEIEKLFVDGELKIYFLGTYDSKTRMINIREDAGVQVW